MLRTRLWVLLCLTGLGQLSLFGCGEDEATTKPHPGAGGSAGSTLGGEGSGETPGGNGATTNGGTTAGSGGSTNGGAPVIPEGGANLGGVFGVGGATDLPGEQLTLCARLSGLTTHAFNVEQGYAKTAIVDCRVTWVIPRKDDLVPFKNALVVWNLQLWGCQGKAVENFALVGGTPSLSQGDANILIDEYMAAADQELELSPPEFEEMKAALERLAKPLVTNASTEPSQPNCPVETGAGGVAGTGSGGAPDGGVGGVDGAGGVTPSAGQGGAQ